jgi:hemin uptake protein HemP
MESKSNVNRITQPAETSPSTRETPTDADAPPRAHEVSPGKRFCEAGPGWCRVCEKMSDIPVLRSEDLLQGRREVLIIHGDEVYRLLCTRNNKLILQK